MPYLRTYYFVTIECGDPVCRNLVVNPDGSESEDSPESWDTERFIERECGYEGFVNEDDWDLCPKCGKHTGKVARWAGARR